MLLRLTSAEPLPAQVGSAVGFLAVIARRRLLDLNLTRLSVDLDHFHRFTLGHLHLLGAQEGLHVIYRK